MKNWGQLYRRGNEVEMTLQLMSNSLYISFDMAFLKKKRNKFTLYSSRDTWELGPALAELFSEFKRQKGEKHLEGLKCQCNWAFRDEVVTAK